jgi:hypothetical protein
MSSHLSSWRAYCVLVLPLHNPADKARIASISCQRSIIFHAMATIRVSIFSWIHLMKSRERHSSKGYFDRDGMCTNTNRPMTRCQKGNPVTVAFPLGCHQLTQKLTLTQTCQTKNFTLQPHPRLHVSLTCLPLPLPGYRLNPPPLSDCRFEFLSLLSSSSEFAQDGLPRCSPSAHDSDSLQPLGNQFHAHLGVSSFSVDNQMSSYRSFPANAAAW